MRNNLRILLRNDLIRMTGWNTLRYEKDKRKKRKILAVLISFLIVGIVMAGYCYSLAYGLGYMKMSDIIPGYALTITGLVTLFFTFFKTNGVLFGSSDYDMLTALPIRESTVITARFLSMYLENLAFTAVVMVPMAVGYAVWKGVSAAAVLMWGIGIAAAPLFPMTIAVLAGLLIMGLGAGAKHKTLVEIVLSLLFLFGVFGISFAVQNKAGEGEAAFLMEMSALGAKISEILHKIYPLSSWFDQALNEKSAAAFLLYVLVSAAVYGIFAVLCARMYKKINSALHSQRTSSDYKMTELKTSGIMSALVKKEAKRFFSSGVYFLNMGIGVILAVVFAVSSAILGLDRVLSDMGLAGNSLAGNLTYAVPFAAAMMINMTSTTSVSISLEGKNFWILQSLPISRKTVLQSKMLFNLLLVGPASILCSVIFMIQLKVPALTAVLYLFVILAAAGFSTVWGSFINLHFPNFTWEREVEVIKQGMASMIGIFSNMLLYLAAAAGALIFSAKISGDLLLFLAGSILSVFALIIYRACMNGKQEEVWLR